ncbi:MAG: tetratricopeptide repeat protein [Gammaproteobacteria bacterium]|nr:tetratricopeptide repeat protein [Gammaproteobacteria bacterium]
MILRFRYATCLLLATLTFSVYLPGAAGQDPVTSSMTGKPHSGGYNPHAKLEPEQLITVALQHMQEGRPNEALHELDRGIVQFKTHAELFAVRGSIYLQMGRLSDALRDLESSLTIHPDDPKTLTNRAQAYRQFGRIEEALQDLNKALTLDPDLIPAHFNRGSIYYSSSEFDKALVDFEQCIALDPHAPAPYFNRASTYDALGKRDAAIKDLERFLELVEVDEWKKVANDLLKQWRKGETASPAGQNNS